jgi:tripartite ATP-independent transporter DctM subunit
VTDIQIGLLSIVGILFLIYAGMHVSIALMLLSLLGVWLIRGNWTIACKLLALAASDSISGYIFGVVPLFVLMGLLISISGIGKDTFDVANRLFKGIRGGLGISTVAANAVFAAVTGISIASAAVFTKVAVPEMIRLGHKPRFAVGVVTGSSVLGMLIPPSLLLILFGVLTETSIGDLFKAGIMPGILLSFVYSGLILLMAWRFPRYVGELSGGSGSTPAMGMSIGQAI